MKATELILNGFYNHNSEWNYAGHEGIFQWSEMDWYKLGEEGINLENVEPIPLTGEWWDKISNDDWDFVGFGTRLILEHKIYNSIKFEFLPNSNQVAIYFNDELINAKGFVHQIQSIYDVLTDEELTLKK